MLRNEDCLGWNDILLSLFISISAKHGAKVYDILLFNSCVKFHAKICTHRWNINESRRVGTFLCSPVHSLFEWYEFTLNMKLCYGVKPGPDYPLFRLYHGREPPPPGAPRRSAAKFLPRCVDVDIWTFSVRLYVTTTKKGRQLFWEKSAPPQIRKSWLRVREKGPALRWYGPPNG